MLPSSVDKGREGGDGIYPSIGSLLFRPWVHCQHKLLIIPNQILRNLQWWAMPTNIFKNVLFYPSTPSRAMMTDIGLRSSLRSDESSYRLFKGVGSGLAGRGKNGKYCRCCNRDILWHLQYLLTKQPLPLNWSHSRQ